MNNEEQDIIKRYTDIKQGGSFAGLSGFSKTAKISLKQAKKALSNLPAFVQHFESRVNYPRLSVLVTEPFQIFAIDLLVLNNYRRVNRNFGYVLTCVECFTRTIYLEPQKLKTAEHTRNAFHEIIKRAKIPRGAYIWCDEGREWLGAFGVLLKEHDLKIYHSTTKIKASVVERYQREIRRRLRKIFEHNKNKKWIEHIQDIAESMNAMVNNTTKFLPKEAASHIDDVLYNVYKKRIVKSIQKPEKILPNGTTVVISRHRLLFEKGSKPFTREKFQVIKYRPSIPVGYYTLSDADGNTIKGAFNRFEIQPVSIARLQDAI